MNDLEYSDVAEKKISANATRRFENVSLAEMDTISVDSRLVSDAVYGSGATSNLDFYFRASIPTSAIETFVEFNVPRLKSFERRKTSDTGKLAKSKDNWRSWK